MGAPCRLQGKPLTTKWVNEELEEQGRKPQVRKGQTMKNHFGSSFGLMLKEVHMEGTFITGGTSFSKFYTSFHVTVIHFL